MDRTCSSLDHIWKSPKWGTLKKGDPCYCGKRKWGIEHVPKKKAKPVVEDKPPS